MTTGPSNRNWNRVPGPRLGVRAGDQETKITHSDDNIQNDIQTVKSRETFRITSKDLYNFHIFLVQESSSVYTRRFFKILKGQKTLPNREYRNFVIERNICWRGIFIFTYISSVYSVIGCCYFTFSIRNSFLICNERVCKA